MARLTAAMIMLGCVSAALLAADRAAEEPAIRADPRPTDLTTGQRGSNDEPASRGESRALDASLPKTVVGRSTLEVGSLTPNQSEQLRTIREKAAAEVKAIHDRERAEIMAVLNEQQRREYVKLEDAALAGEAGRPATAPAPATAPVAR